MGILLAPVRAAALLLVAALLAVTQLPPAFGWTSTVVPGDSMAPGIRAGDVAISSPVSPADARRLAPGTVLLANDPASPGDLLLHRFLGRDRKGLLITKGDANLKADGTHLHPDAVRGQLRLRIPMIGLPVLWFRERRVLPLLGLAALALVLLGWRPRPR